VAGPASISPAYGNIGAGGGEIWREGGDTISNGTAKFDYAALLGSGSFKTFCASLE
jgi:hypothetical protein